MATRKSTRSYSVDEVLINFRSINMPPEWSDDINRLIIATCRKLAEGFSITPEQVDELISRVGIDPDEGQEFLRGVSERDEDDNIRGLIGLSLNQHPHSFKVDDVQMATWCAWDTLFLAPVLGATAIVRSSSPVTGEAMDFTIGPDGVKSAPEGATVTIVLVDPEDIDMDSLESIYMTFCHQVFFFASREEAEEWTGDKDYNFAVLTVDEAFELGQKAFAGLLRHA